MEFDPYNAPLNTSGRSIETEDDDRRVTIPAFLLAVTISSIIMAALMPILFEVDNQLQPHFIFVTTYLLICGVCVFLFASMRNSKMEIGKRLLYGILVSIPVYILFIPICTFGGAMTMSIGMNGREYMPSALGIALATFVTVGALTMIALQISLAVINRRRSLRRTAAGKEKADVKTPA